MQGTAEPVLDVSERGVPGDRAWAVLRDGRPLSAKKWLRLLEYRASGMPEIYVETPSGERLPWGVPVLRALEADLGSPLELVHRPYELYDDAPLLLVTRATLAAVQAAFGKPLDVRRFRPNVVLEGATSLEEASWPGRRLRIGSVELEATHACERCVMITVDPDTAERTPTLLKWLHEHYEGRFGMYARVVQAGQMRVGDEVVFV